MQNITSVAALKNAIQFKEVEQAVKGQLLKEQLYFTLENLKPANLIKGTLKDLASSPKLYENVLGTVVGIATGYLSKKIIVGFSGGIISKIFGSILQIGVTSAVAQNPAPVAKFGKFVFNRVFRAKQLKAKKP